MSGDCDYSADALLARVHEMEDDRDRRAAGAMSALDEIVDRGLECLVAACLVAKAELHELAHPDFGLPVLEDFRSKAVVKAVANLRHRGVPVDRDSVARELVEHDQLADIHVWYPKLVEQTPAKIDDQVFVNQTASLVRLAGMRAQAIADAEIELERQNIIDAKAPPKRKKKKGEGDVALAARYVRQNARVRDGVTLRRWRGDWYRWREDLGSYATISEEQLESDLYRKLQLARRSDVANVKHALIAVDDVLIDGVELGTWLGNAPDNFHPFAVAACRNGLLNLETGKLTPATPRYFATTALGVSFGSAPIAMRWHAFLRELWPDDEDSIATLQEWFGYCLTPDTRQQKALMLIGPKRSGKGTIARVLISLLGTASVASPTLASLGAPFGLWPLLGKTAAVIGDARLGSRSDIAQIVERLLTITGEDSVTVDRKHREPWIGKLSTRISIISNELPRFTDASDALANRMVVLQLRKSWLGREDTTLTDALLSELPGILEWAISGWQRLRARGHFLQPASSSEAIDELVDLASPVAAWARERCDVTERDPKYWLKCEDAYADYTTWCKKNGHYETSQTIFGRDVKAALGCDRKQVRRDGALPRVYEGLTLKSGVQGIL